MSLGAAIQIEFAGLTGIPLRRWDIKCCDGRMEVVVEQQTNDVAQYKTGDANVRMLGLLVF